MRSSTQTKYSWVGRLQKPEETPKEIERQEKARHGGHIDAGLRVVEELERKEGDFILEGLQDVQRSPPKTLIGLSKGAGSKSAGPLKTLGNIFRKNGRTINDDDKEDVRQRDATSDNLSSYEQIRLWREQTGQAGRLYLRRGPQRQQTGVG